MKFISARNCSSDCAVNKLGRMLDSIKTASIHPIDGLFGRLMIQTPHDIIPQLLIHAVKLTPKNMHAVRMPVLVSQCFALPRVCVRICSRRNRREAVRDELPHDPADLVQVRPPVLVPGRGLPEEVGQVDGGVESPLLCELLRNVVVGFAE